MPLINIHRMFLLRVNISKGADAIRGEKEQNITVTGTNWFCDSCFVDSRDYIYHLHNPTLNIDHVFSGVLWCLTPLSTIFLYFMQTTDVIMESY